MNFQQLFLVLWARRLWVGGSLGLVLLVTLVVSLLLPKSYVASTSLVVDVKAVDPITGMAVPAQFLPSYLATQVDIIKSQNVAGKVVDALKLTQNPVLREQYEEEAKGRGTMRDWIAGKIQNYLEVEPSRTSNMIQVSFRGSDPDFAAAMANAFAQSYIQTSLELRTEPARLTTTFFNAQIKSLAETLEQARAKLSAYQREHGIVAVEEPLDVEMRRLADLSSQLVATQAQSIDANSRLRQLDNAVKESGRADTVSDVLMNPLVQNLKADLARAENKLAEASEKLGRNHPEYQRLSAEIESIKRKIESEVRVVSASVANSARAARQREAELRAAMTAQKDKVLGSTEKRDELILLTREVENAQRTYDMAAQRFGQSRMASQTDQTEIAVLNRAVPPLRASSPRLMLNMLLALFLGGLLGVSFGFGVEMLDRRVRSPEDLQSVLGIPVLGMIQPDPRPSRWARWRPPFLRLKMA